MGSGALGTLQPPSFDHLLLPSVQWYNSSRNVVTSGVWQKNLQQLAQRMFSPWQAPATNITLRLQYHYWEAHSHSGSDVVVMWASHWEAHIIGAPLFPSGVKFLIGVFPDLFGTPAGQELQAWAGRWGWSLVWALGPNLPSDNLDFYGSLNQTQFAGNHRFVDPKVLASPNNTMQKNFTVAPTVGDGFDAVWATVEVARRRAGASGEELSPAQWAGWWEEMLAPEGAHALDVQPLRPRRCASAERCIGTNALGDCLCYNP